MNAKLPDKPPAMTPKSFMAVGPTLHYSHENVQRCWFLAMLVFCLTCLFWSKIATGSFASFDSTRALTLDSCRLDRFVLSGASIFEYPWQILVLGALMGILAIAPVLVALLMSFSHSLPLVFAIFFIANLPGFAAVLLVSCIGVACRPLRFRSRIIAVALCMSPQLVYWSYFGGARGGEPLVWGFSFSPWACAWLIGLAIAGGVLIIGHYTRYKPGLVWTSTGVILTLTLIVFETKIGFDELAFQIHVAENNPELVSEFHSHSITDALDRRMEDPTTREFLLDDIYAKEPIPLRQELKREIQIQLGDYGRWPGWFELLEVPDALNFLEKRKSLARQYDLFITPSRPWWMPKLLHAHLVRRRSNTKRMATTLYFKGLLSEYNQDVSRLDQEKEMLHLYSDYPFERSHAIWFLLDKQFPESPEALEAQWRIAMRRAGRGQFARAEAQALQTKVLLKQHLAEMPTGASEEASIATLFQTPPKTVMTRLKLVELRSRVDRLLSLIDAENRGEDQASLERLARFVRLNPHTMDYDDRLAHLRAQMGPQDCLQDNVRFAEIKLIADDETRLKELAAHHDQFHNTDGGIEAMFELGLLETGLYRAQTDPEQKKNRLRKAILTLDSFLKFYPDSIYAEQVKKNLSDLPVLPE